MDRRNFLRILPISAIAPKVIKDGVLSVELPQGAHFVILVDARKVDPVELAQYPAGLLPAGSTGGWIISCPCAPDEAIKFYRLDKE